MSLRLSSLTTLLLFLAPAAASGEPESPSPLPPESPYTAEQHALFRYERLPAGWTHRLQAACRHCQRVEFVANILSPESPRMVLERGKGLEAILDVLEAQPCWYERLVDESLELELKEVPALHFYAADGTRLLTLELFPGGPAHAHLHGSYLSLWELCRLLPESEPEPTTPPLCTELRLAKNNKLAHLAANPGGRSRTLEDGFCLEGELGENYYVFLRDDGSALANRKTQVYHRGEDGQWQQLAEERINTWNLSLTNARLSGSVLTFVDSGGNEYPLVLPETPEPRQP